MLKATMTDCEGLSVRMFQCDSGIYAVAKDVAVLAAGRYTDRLVNHGLCECEKLQRSLVKRLMPPDSVLPYVLRGSAWAIEKSGWYPFLHGLGLHDQRATALVELLSARANVFQAAGLQAIRSGEGDGRIEAVVSAIERLGAIAEGQQRELADLRRSIGSQFGVEAEPTFPLN